ncbi:MAG: efflux RND transporter periplasmic adaptor subunit [Deltaproteobacteria bacterium]|jgi:membrane fusion protein (multidrug efflux system)|nr:efflux RND transporter periplasmic adaptor subunit [Deltaproteobacteria bacterium]
MMIYLKQFTQKCPGRFGRLILLCLAVLPLAGGCSDSDDGHKAPPPPRVGVITLKAEPVPLHVELPGRASAYTFSEVRPQVSGLIQQRLFTEGSNVEEGQQLYQIDPALYQAAYDTAVANQKRAEAAWENTRVIYNRYSEVVKKNAVSRQDYDTALANYRLAQAEVAAAKASVTTAKINLEYTKVYAPVAGRIGISSVTPGMLVTANQGNALAQIQQMDPIYIDLVQSSAEYLKLQRHIQDGEIVQAAMGKIPVDLILEDGKSYDRTAYLKLYDVNVDQTTGSITLRAEVENPNQLILPGMFVRAKVNEGTIQKAILVPQQAVQRNQKGLPYVLVVSPENVVELRVFKADLGVFQNSWITMPGLFDEKGNGITAEQASVLKQSGKLVVGLLEGEQIIMEGSLRLRGGTAASPVAYVPPSERNQQQPGRPGAQPPTAAVEDQTKNQVQ